jgi:hypothetical protein
MGNETVKKRQKESARREKQAKKAARLMERKNEKAKTGSEFPEENPKTTEHVSRPEPKELLPAGCPKYLYFTRPRDGKIKSASTLYSAENRRNA